MFVKYYGIYMIVYIIFGILWIISTIATLVVGILLGSNNSKNSIDKFINDINIIILDPTLDVLRKFMRSNISFSNYNDLISALIDELEKHEKSEDISKYLSKITDENNRNLLLEGILFSIISEFNYDRKLLVKEEDNDKEQVIYNRCEEPVKTFEAKYSMMKDIDNFYDN